MSLRRSERLGTRDDDTGDGALGGKQKRGSGLRNVLKRLALMGIVVAFFVVAAAYHGVLDAREGELKTAMRRLEAALDEEEDKVRQLSRELSKRQEEVVEEKSEVETLKKELHQKEEMLKKAQAKLKTYDSVQDRISEDKLVKALQKQTRIFNHLRWGEGPARVALETQRGYIEIETAPFDVMPHTVHYFLTMVETGFWDGCHIIRNAHHVMQMNCNHRKPRPMWGQPSVAFQEFDPSYHHKQWTVGVAGRPGGVDWYINLVDNQASHGPGGQGPEADPCFGRLVKGQDVVQQLHKDLGHEFLKDDGIVEIIKARILKPGKAHNEPEEEEPDGEDSTNTDAAGSGFGSRLKDQMA